MGKVAGLRGGGGGGMSWEIGIDMYALICIKQITNKNLLYKKLNKIKFKKKSTNNKCWRVWKKGNPLALLVGM